MKLAISIDTSTEYETMSWRDLVDLIDTLAPSDHRLPIAPDAAVSANRYGVISIVRAA